MVNFTKSVQMKEKLSVSNHTFESNSKLNAIKPVCKCLGVYIDLKFPCKRPIDFFKRKLCKQCGIVSK